MKAIQKHFLFFLALSGILLLVFLITPFFQPQKTSSYGPEETPPAHPAKVSTSASGTDSHSSHNHDKSDRAEAEPLPADLEAWVASKRIPASQIPMTRHANGNITLHAGDQWSTVVMAVVDDSGRVSTHERQITPHGAVEVKP